VLLAVLTFHFIVKYIKRSTAAYGWTEDKELGVTLFAIIATTLIIWMLKTSISEDRSS
jgi:hypothetical protein